MNESYQRTGFSKEDEVSSTKLVKDSWNLVDVLFSRFLQRQALLIIPIFQELPKNTNTSQSITFQLLKSLQIAINLHLEAHLSH